LDRGGGIKEFGMLLSSILYITLEGDKWNSPFSKFESKILVFLIFISGIG
jgi:hypothetical protein